MHLKQLLCAALAAGTALSCALPVQALSGVSAWAQTEITAAQTSGLEPDTLSSARATAPITRAEFCEIALTLYAQISGKQAAASTKKPFLDTSSPAVATAYALGLVSGRGNGIFDPSGPITRQELCKMLDNVLSASGYALSDPDPETLASFADRSVVASWATQSVERMLDSEIMRGVSRLDADATGEASTVVELKPSGTTTREQALIMALRFTQTYASAQKQTPTVPSVSPGQDIADPDGDVSAASSFHTSDKETGTQTDKDHEDTQSKSDAQDKKTDKSDEDTQDARHEQENKNSSSDTPDTAPSSLPESEEEKMEFVFGEGGSFFASSEIAEAAMTEISIPVWRLENGVKTAGKAHVTVNRRLAAIYTAVFIEIYNGQEKFPISDLGSYAWRESPTSEHRWGTAIDLNYDANMECNIDADGNVTAITCGTHWTPGEDPYSIPEDGDVYNAFTKYGFAWGGNAWRNKRDYMHFSYFGR